MTIQTLQKRSSREQLERSLKILQESKSDPKIAQLEYELCKKDPWHWLTNWVYTLDQHDKENPIKLFPDKEYLKNIVEIWLKEPLVLIEKSRQMLISWLMVALYLHDAQFNQGRFIFFQSKKEQDANSLVDRAKFIYHHQPFFLKERLVEESYCRLKFLDLNSMIVGIPQGAEQIRMHTASGVFSDEMAFQYEAEGAYNAAKPCIDGGGRYTGVSSANPSFFQRLAEENRNNQGGGFKVITVHYSLDPDKAKPEWVRKTREGISEEAWKREYEIDYGALSGELIYPEFNEGLHTIDPFPIQSDWARIRGIDPGLRNPLCCLWCAVDYAGNLYFYREHYQAGLTIKEHAGIILKLSAEEEDINLTLIDPSAGQRTLGQEKTVIEQFRDYEIRCRPADNSLLPGIQRVKDLLRADPETGKPRLFIFKNCINLIREIKTYRWAEFQSEEVARDRNIKEEPIKKDDHAMDAMRYIVNGYFKPNKKRRKRPRDPRLDPLYNWKVRMGIHPPIH